MTDRTFTSKTDTHLAWVVQRANGSEGSLADARLALAELKRRADLSNYGPTKRAALTAMEDWLDARTPKP